MMLSNSQYFCLGFRPGAEQASFNSMGQYVQALSQLGAAFHSPVLLPGALPPVGERWAAVSVCQPQKAGSAPHTKPGTHVARCDYDKRIGRHVGVLRSYRGQKLGRCPLGWPGGLQGWGLSWREGQKKTTAWWAAGMKTNPIRHPTHPRAGLKSLESIGSLDSNVVTCRIKSVQWLAQLQSWEMAQLMGMGAEPGFCIQPKPSQISSELRPCKILTTHKHTCKSMVRCSSEVTGSRD